MSSTVISIENLAKRYRLGVLGSRRLVDDASRWWARIRGRPDPLAKVDGTGALAASDDAEILWALRDVSFDVRQGEVIGILGRNGAGKSTLLKVLSRITAPTSGQIRIAGRIASLLEVGTGFHPELTGRENVYLNGAILGMTKREIRSKFEEIIEFAEITRFVDTPVKRYSSGMYVRLAFAVAAHLEPEILIVDEVLAVGDAAFQKKCLGKMQHAAGQGRTILFVSHNMAAITRLCGRVAWLERGKLREQGPTEEIVARYLASGAEEVGEVRFGTAERKAPASDTIRLEAVRVLTHAGQVSSTLDVREPFSIEVEYQILRRAANLRVGFRLTNHEGAVLFSSTDMDDDGERERPPGRYRSRCQVPCDLLNFGQYVVSVGADTPMVQSHFLVDQALVFHIAQTGGVGGHISDGRQGLLRPRLPWNVERTES